MARMCAGKASNAGKSATHGGFEFHLGPPRIPKNLELMYDVHRVESLITNIAKEDRTIRQPS